MTFQISHLNKAVICLSLLAACALQMQMDILTTPTYAGLRLCLADFLLPLAGVLMAASLFLKQSDWPVYKVKNVYYWLIAMTAVLGISIYTGYAHEGVISHWGLYNKFLGWFVLLAYFFWGAWLAHNGKIIKTYKFFRIFAIFALIVGTVGATVITLQDFNLLNGYIAYPFKGLMANRNAFGFLTLSVTILMFFYGQSHKPLLGRKAELFFWFILPLIHVQIGSRSCWILMILQIAAFVFINRSYFLRKVAPGFSAGCLLVFIFSILHAHLPSNVHHMNFVFKQNQDIQFVQIPKLVRQFTGPENDPKQAANSIQSDMLRLKVNGLALELWAKSPVLGTGLGTTQAHEPAKFGEFLDVIDSTPILILTETGLVGIIIFALFFWLIIFNLSVDLKVSSRNTQTINSIALGIFLTFAIMSVMHELLYTRFLWFILGVALTIPAIYHQEKSQSDTETLPLPL